MIRWWWFCSGLIQIATSQVLNNGQAIYYTTAGNLKNHGLFLCLLIGLLYAYNYV
ncbi:hypothetical protein BDR03DRAFT_959764 [Suillus americanus]|nr:hypothetical protein BDR03DRAFT_959764 [Suillus americanus]